MLQHEKEFSAMSPAHAASPALAAAGEKHNS
jgi:hypothetical protein